MTTFPGESPEHRTARDALLEREIELRREMEAVAAARRELPPGGVVPKDYVFQGPGPDGSTVDVRMSELFAPGPCPSCTALLDQLEGVMFHAGPRLNLYAVAGAPLERVLTFAQERGWRHLRVLSAAGSSFKRDYHGETADGSQIPILNVFERDGDTIRHFWSSELMFAATDADQDPRHVGTIEPLWNLFDLTREGRVKGWDEQLRY